METVSRERSAATGRPYGIQRVCAAWDVARSTVYLRRKRSTPPTAVGPAPRRGPRPPLSDDELLARIRAYLQASPFAGEGHRKVFAHLKIVEGIRTSRNRVRRLMRENSLLSPYRRPSENERAHDGSLAATLPNRLWGTDGFRVQTVEEGGVWGFIAVDHFNSECVGYHVCKEGTRFNALEPIRMGLEACFGSVGRGAALGLTLRMDHGCPYTSDHFLHPIAYWSITRSFAFVSQPQGNGIAERFIKTLKQQSLYGRIFRNTQEGYQTVSAFLQQPLAHRAAGLPHPRRSPHLGLDPGGCWMLICVQEIRGGTPVRSGRGMARRKEVKAP